MILGVILAKTEPGAKKVDISSLDLNSVYGSYPSGIVSETIDFNQYVNIKRYANTISTDNILLFT
jgi:hypothetical protein